MTTFVKRIFACCLTLSFVLPALLVPRDAQAQLPVIDAANLAVNGAAEATLASLLAHEVGKEDLLDAIAWQLANVVLQSVTSSVVNWINSGFNGSPAFVQDLSRNLTGVADAVAAEFIGQLADQLEDTPMRGTVEAIAYGYYLSTSGDAFVRQQLYTLRDVAKDDLAFTQGDFDQGGWRGWMALTQNPANNPYGSYLNAKAELDQRIGARLNERMNELLWNDGFLSWRGDCPAPADGSPVSLGSEEQCPNAPIETPGSVIQAQLNATLDIPNDRLKVADEVNEIISALVSQLVMQALQGLSTVGSSASGGSGYIDRASAEVERGVDGLLLGGIEEQTTSVAEYQSSWLKISTAANKAELCTEASNEEEKIIIDAKLRSEKGLIKSSIALTSLQGILSDIEGGSNQSGDAARVNLLPESARKYQTVITSGTLPSAVEIAEVRAQVNATDPDSLYSQLVRISDRCESSS